MKLSKHSLERIKERANINANQKAFFRNALDKGKSPGEIKNEKIRVYLMSKETWRSKVKLYKGYVFIYSKNNKRLYTMYKMEEL